MNEYSSSDDSGTPPDRVLTDSDEDDDYPGFHQRSRSGPWSQKTVFRAPGYGGREGSSGRGPDRDADAPRDSVMGGTHLGLIRFGSFLVPCPHPARVSSLPATRSFRDEAITAGVSSGRSENLDGRDFDPMRLEAEVGLLRQACRLDEATTLASSPSPVGDVLLADPMIVECDLLPAPTTPSTCDEECPLSPFHSQPQGTPRSPARPSSPEVALESVRFEVPCSELVCCDSALRHITVARGTRETLPLHLFPDASSPVKEVVANFANSVCGDPPAPVLPTSPPRRQSQRPPQSFFVRRSERLAKKSRHRATKPVVQAQNVMMKKLGITSDARPPDASSYQQFADTFSSTLPVTHCEALDALLPKGMGSMATEVVVPVLVP